MEEQEEIPFFAFKEKLKDEIYSLNDLDLKILQKYEQISEMKILINQFTSEQSLDLFKKVMHKLTNLKELEIFLNVFQQTKWHKKYKIKENDQCNCSIFIENNSIILEKKILDFLQFITNKQQLLLITITNRKFDMATQHVLLLSNFIQNCNYLQHLRVIFERDSKFHHINLLPLWNSISQSLTITTLNLDMNDISLSKHNLELLGPHLSKLNQLQKLKIKMHQNKFYSYRQENNIFLLQFCPLFDNIASLKNLKNLNISLKMLNKDDDQGIQLMESILNCFKSVVQLESLSFNLFKEYNIKDKGAIIFANALEYLKNLKKLTLQIYKNNISSIGMSAIGRGLKYMLDLNKLGIIFFSHLLKGAKGISGLQESLFFLKSLQTIHLEIGKDNQLRVKGYQKLSESFRNLQNLKQLTIIINDRNEFDCECAKHLFRNLSFLVELDTFVLHIGQHNNINHEGLVELGNVILKLKLLSNFSLFIKNQQTELDEKGIIHLYQSLRNQQQIQKLQLDIFSQYDSIFIGLLEVKQDVTFQEFQKDIIKLRDGNVIQGLDIRINNKQKLKGVMIGLRDIHNLTNLSFDIKYRVDVEDIQELGNQIQQIKQLKCFDLKMKTENLKLNQIIYFFQQININLEDLSIQIKFSECESNDISKFSDCLARFSNLKKLKVILKNSQIDKYIGANNLIKSLSSIVNLNDLMLQFSLNLNQTADFVFDFQYGFQNLKNLRKLKTLFQQEQFLTFKGVMDFKKGLKYLENLIYLDIAIFYYLKVNDETHLAFVNTIIQQKQVIKLNFTIINYDNQQQKQSILHALSQLQKLNTLELRIGVAQKYYYGQYIKRKLLHLVQFY